jgi:hypothetical protein
MIIACGDTGAMHAGISGRRHAGDGERVFVKC